MNPPVNPAADDRRSDAPVDRPPTEDTPSGDVDALSYQDRYRQRRGVVEVSWTTFSALCKGLALALADYAPETVVGLTRGGVYPAAQLSHLLRADLVVLGISRRERDRVVHRTPVLTAPPADRLTGRRVLVVDEICDSGETLVLARAEVERVGAAETRTCVLYSHTRAVHVPDYVGLVSDELLMNPWDREVLEEGRLVRHPEYVAALSAQGLEGSHLGQGTPPVAPAVTPATGR
ncbi:MAG: hypothetical protein GXX79_10440 [Actinomycetales bacterium]|nr:hypothetical protein [Actinomycetales bacterium]